MTDKASPPRRRVQELEGMRKPKAGETTRRPCLRCGEPFPSEGAHNRLCEPCRQSIRRADPGMPDARLAR